MAATAAGTAVGAGGDSSAGNKGSNTLYSTQGKEFVPLSTTHQSVETTVLDGKNVTIFDHPFDGTAKTICNQGSAYPTGPRQTCGCCASGTIINKAGGNTNEHKVVAYALDNKLCSPEGFTSPNSWARILNDAGIEASVRSDSTLEELAAEVENGQGVILGISSCVLHGRYFPGKEDGHAVVLESVIRDVKTGRIVEYVISDSNGPDVISATRRVEKKVLERAFKWRGRSAVVTDEIIW